MAIAQEREWALACRGEELLSTVHKIGPVLARSMCRRAGFSPRSYLRDVPAADRARVVQLLNERAIRGPQVRSDVRGPRAACPARQRDRALQNANVTKAARYTLRAALREREAEAALEHLADVIADRSREFGLNGMTIAAALLSVKNIGTVAAERICGEAGIDTGRTFGHLDRMSAQRRERIIGTLRRVAKEPTDGKLDATVLLEWLDDLRFQPANTWQYETVRKARSSGRISLALVDRLLVSVGRSEMLAVLYP